MSFTFTIDGPHVIADNIIDLGVFENPVQIAAVLTRVWGRMERDNMPAHRRVKVFRKLLSDDFRNSTLVFTEPQALVALLAAVSAHIDINMG